MKPLLTFAALALLGLVVPAHADPQGAKFPMPDFTTGIPLPIGAAHDWTLGVSGARGWIYSSGSAEGNTLESRQILITKVEPNTTASGKLVKGDVILGIGERAFQSDARRAFANALTNAEAADGKLNLLRWRDGETQTVTLTLPKLGAWSATAPYDCAKSDAILKAGCEVIAEGGLKQPGIPNNINALALLASGDESYRPLLSGYVKRVLAKPLDESMSLPCWSFAFTNLFLAEYKLATGDAGVLTEMKRLSHIIAIGQGPLGTWGHRFVNTETRRLYGYGAVNAVGLPLAISLVLAREAGVEDPLVDAAIERSASFFRRFVGLGAIPYGDHPPNTQYGHDDNGKNSAAAVLFDLLGDPVSTDYYVRTAGAAFDADREQGHTGNFFNMFWSLPAVARGGPALSGAWLAEFGWYYDLARHADGSFQYQGFPTQTTGSAYSNWDCPGAWVLHFALPKHAIRITGSKLSCIKPFDAATVSQVISAGKNDYASMDGKALVNALAGWSPIVHEAAKKELAKRGEQVPDEPWKAFANPDPQVRIGALSLLALLPDKEASGKPFQMAAVLLDDPLPEVRIAAARAMIAVDRKQAAEVIFRHLVDSKDGDSPTFSQIAVMSLVPSSAKKDGAWITSIGDRELVHSAIVLLMNHEDAAVGGRIVSLVSALPEVEQRRLLPDLLACATDPPRGDAMFESGLTLGCLRILAKFHVREALPLVVRELTYTGWGKQPRVTQAAQIIPDYGTHAQAFLAPLREMNASLDPKNSASLIAVYNKLIHGIESSRTTPELISIRAD